MKSLKITYHFFAFTIAFIIFLSNISYTVVSPGDLNQKLQSLKYTNNYYVCVKDIILDKVLYTFDTNDTGNTPLAIGSVIKIFTIVSKFKNKDVDFTKTHLCRGYGDDIPYTQECWLKQGHKDIDLIRAIAYSCNTYFYYFVQDLDFFLFLDTLKEFGVLNSSGNWGRKIINRDEQVQAMLGKMNIIKIRPVDLINGLSRIFKLKKNGLSSELNEILSDGLSGSYQYGTASKSMSNLKLDQNLSILCKTGTAVYEKKGEINRKKTNGIFIGIYQKKYLIIVFAEDTAGSDGASFMGLSIIKELMN